MVSFYFVSTTVTTVGYGDISAENNLEYIFSIVMLFVGVISFAALSGSLSSMITNYDNQQAGLKQKLETLQRIRKQYKLNPALVHEL